MSPGGRHGHKVRELKRRMDAVIEEERERRRPPPPPVSAEHAAMRERIEREWAALLDQLPEDVVDIVEGVRKNPDLAGPAAELGVLMREEEEFLAERGIDHVPYGRYKPKF